MVNFVLVHGAMHGGWCWKNVRSILAKAGYSVLTPTLNVTDVAGGLSIYFHPEALPAFSEIAQKLPSASFIPENLFPSISARHDLMDGTGKFNPRSCVTLLCNHAKFISRRLLRYARYGLQNIRVESCPFSDLKNKSALADCNY